MRLVILIATLSLFLSVSQAQTRFSFSGLSWGESLDQVEVKLKSAEFKLSREFKNKISCRVQSNCSLDFEGQVRGSASFESGKLVEVRIFSDSNTYSERAAKLKERYGAPLPNPPSTGGGILATLEGLNLNWRSADGETLQLDSSGAIFYRSGTINNAEEGKRNSVKF